jgi:hypothetical protein
MHLPVLDESGHYLRDRRITRRSRGSIMTEATVAPTSASTLVDHIPVLWFTSSPRRPASQLVIWLNGLSGTKEQMSPYLQELAAAGFVALSFDAWPPKRLMHMA